MRLTDGVAQIAYGFAEVADIVAMSGDVRPVAGAGEIRGVTLIEGEQVEVLDLHWLFAAYAGAAEQGSERPLCLLPTGDPWMDTILRPIVESAGYRILRAGEPGAEDAQVIIVAEDEPAPAAEGDAKIVRLRSDLKKSGRKDGSIHRYDRAALLGALGRKG
jgi:two-component system chemotaxis sensor kinase CheA